MIFVFTHDAMGDGEDGPTHQPVEHLAAMRAMPGLTLFRPGDANEVVEAYRYVMQVRHRPALLVLSRQPLATLDRNKYAAASGVARGAYVLADAPDGKPEIILLATGSELGLAADTHERLIADGIRSRVVSMPSWDVFERETQEYRDAVLPPEVYGSRCNRAGVNIRLGALRRQDRAGHRHAYVWSVRTAEGLAAGVRIYRRSCHSDGQCAAAAIESRIAWSKSGNKDHHVRLSMPGLTTHRPILPATGRRSGLIVSERAWGTVREDYSTDGRAWQYFPYEHARSRAYRWNEDGLAGLRDRRAAAMFCSDLLERT